MLHKFPAMGFVLALIIAGSAISVLSFYHRHQMFPWQLSDRIEALERTQVRLCNLPGVVCIETRGRP